MLEAEVKRISNRFIWFGSAVLPISISIITRSRLLVWEARLLLLLLLDVTDVFADAHRGQWTQLFYGYFPLLIAPVSLLFDGRVECDLILRYWWSCHFRIKCLSDYQLFIRLLRRAEPCVWHRGVFCQRHSDVWWTFSVFVLAYVALENFFEAGLHKLKIFLFVLGSRVWARIVALRDDWHEILVSRIFQHKKRVWCFKIILNLLQLQPLLWRILNSLRWNLSTAFIWNKKLLSDAALIVITDVEGILEPTTVYGLVVKRFTVVG